jgi:transcriptional regulator with XRE-family HTH domain
VIEADVYEDTIRNCACGCGEEVNPFLAVFESAVADGLNQSEIAARYGVSPSYVGQLLRNPPTTVKGHQARIFWQSPEGQAIRDRSRMLRDQDRLMRRKSVARRRLLADERRRERSLFFDHLSLDAPVGSESELTLHGVVGSAENPETLYLEAEWSDEIKQILGDLNPARIARLDEDTLEHLRFMLAEAGLVGIKVTREERERLELKRSVRRSYRASEVERIAALGGERVADLDVEAWTSYLGGDNPDEDSHHRSEPLYRARKRAREVERFERRQRKAAAWVCPE